MNLAEREQLLTEVRNAYPTAHVYAKHDGRRGFIVVLKREAERDSWEFTSCADWLKFQTTRHAALGRAK